MIPKIFTTLSRDVTRYVSTLAVAALMIALAPQNVSAQTTLQNLQDQINLVDATLSNAIVSVNGRDVYVGLDWWTASSKQRLADATDDARLGLSQSSGYDAYIGPLLTEIDIFKAAKNGGLKYNYEALDEAILKAKEAIDTTKISNDGTDVAYNKYWVKAADLATLQTTLGASEDMPKPTPAGFGNHGSNVIAATTNQSTINAQVGLLTSATAAFAGAATTGVTPDYSALQAEIVNAKAVLNATYLSAAGDGSDVPNGSGYVTAQSTLDAFKSIIEGYENAIKNGSYVTGNLSANNNNVSNAVNALQGQISGFQALLGNGIGALLLAYNSLNAAVIDANAAIASVSISGCSGNDIDPTDFWVTQTDVNALQTLIDAAPNFGPSANDGTDLTNKQGQINAAFANLTSQTASFLSTAQNGFKPNYANLQTRITTSSGQIAPPAVYPSTDGLDIDNTDNWATPANIATFQAAIELAQGYINTPCNSLANLGSLANNQAAVNQAEVTLQTAENAFMATVSSGEKTGASNFAALDALIALAQGSLDTVVSSASNGADVMYGTYWVINVNHAALVTAYNAANTIKTTNPTLTQLTNATNDLQTALSAFGTPQYGLGANIAVLNDLIASAAAKLARLTSSQPDSIVLSLAGGTDVIFGTYWVGDTMNLRNAYDAAVAATTTPPALHSALVTSIVNPLNNALMQFQPTLNAPNLALPNYAMLADTIAKYAADTVGIKVSANGDGSEYAASVKWVTLADWNVIQTAFNAANMVITSTSANMHDDIELAIFALKGALWGITPQPGAMPVYFTVTTLPNSFVNAEYAPQITTTPPPTNIRWSYSGKWPTGLLLDTLTGVISGQILKADTFNFSITASQTGGGVGSDTRPFTIIVYDEPSVAPTDTVHGFASDTLVDVITEFVILFPMKMDTTIAGKVKVPFHRISGYWTSDTTYVIPHPYPCYEYEWNYSVAVSGLKDSAGVITYSTTYRFRTPVAPPLPNITRIIMFENLAEGVDSLVMSAVPSIDANTFRITSGEDFAFSLNVLPDQSEYAPEVLTNRIIDGVPEVLTGVLDATIANRYNFVVRAVHQHIRLTVDLVLNSSNQLVGQSSVWASDGKLNVSTQQPGQLSVYAITGELVVQTNVSDSSTISLPRGVYIVRLHGKAYKVVL